MTKKNIVNEISGLTELKSLVEAYQEIAALRMQKVRASVLKSRDYLYGLNEIYGQVKKNSKGSGLRAQGTKKSVAVLISANVGLYGSIVNRVSDQFIQYVQSNKSEVVVVGKLGIRLMQDKLPNILYNYYDFSDEGVNWKALGVIMRYLLQFANITVFYGQFKSIVNQEAMTKNLAGEVFGNDQILPQSGIPLSGTNPKTQIQYLFEPSVDDILEVFQSEILASVFGQTIHESQLAKFASRILHLDDSLQNVDSRLQAVHIDYRRLQHDLMSRKQLSRMAGVSLWQI